jgi:glycosyltransferase involved in cell wall biosynthesis
MSVENYVIITPVKDEEKYIELTIKSVINQTIKPLQWIIVDDGSIDRTREIIEEYSSRHTWIKGVHYSGNSGPRMAGERHIKAFYEGYTRLDNRTWDFIVKLDGDLSFNEDYFERCFSYFKENPKLGIGGGIILDVTEGTLIPERHPLFHVRGATKIYRRECWDAIGGLVVATCYDTLDEVKANMLGYETRSFPDLRVLHHRYTGGAYGMWRNSVKNGLSDYIAGYHPLFMVSKCLKRFVQKPYKIDAIGLLHGYISGYIKDVPQVPDKALISYLRDQQLRRLFFRKSIWR